jgi:predicted Zn-dependent peptidase
VSVVRELAREGLTEEELAKARCRHAWELTAMRDSAEEMGAFYAVGHLFARSEAPEERARKLAAVTAPDVRSMARSLCEPHRLNVIAVGLLENGEDRRLTDVVKGWGGAS